MSANKPNPPAIDVAGLPFRPGSGCPEPVSPGVAGLETRFPGARSSFSALGVTHARLLPDMAMALRHAHAREEEFAHVPEGHPMPVTGAGGSIAAARTWSARKPAAPVATMPWITRR